MKRIATRSLSPSGGRWVFAGEFSERWSVERPPISGQKTDLWMVKTDGTGLERLTTNGTSNNPEWEPNEGSIFFDDKGSIRTISVAVCDPSPKEGRPKAERCVGTIREAYVSDSGKEYVIYGEPKFASNQEATAVSARDGQSEWVEVTTWSGRQIARFARAGSHQWTADSRLLLGFASVIFDWQNLLPLDSSEVETHEKPSPKPDRRLLTGLLQRVRKTGVTKIVEYVPSPSGHKIAFVGAFQDMPQQPVADLWLINRDGSGLERLTYDRCSFEPEWSPSGREVAFAHYDSINVVDVGTKKVRSLPALKGTLKEDSPSGFGHERPHWSPNGKVIAAKASNISSLVSVVEATSGKEVLKTAASKGPIDFTWNKDGDIVIQGLGRVVFDWSRTLAYGSPSHGWGDAKLEDESAAPSDPLVRSMLRRGIAKGLKTIRGYIPTPSGERQVFVGEFEGMWRFGFGCGGSRTDLWLINKDGTGLRRLTNDGMSYDPAWSPSGNELTFADEGSIKVMNLRTGAARGLRGLRGGVSGTGEYNCSQYGKPKWSPNGKAIAAEGGNGGTAWIAAAEARSGKEFFNCGDCEDAAGDFAWNDASELLFADYQGPVKVIFDWTAITNRPRPASARRFLFKQNGKFGYFNGDGETAIKPQFSDAGQFSEALAPVAFDGKWGYINKTGELANIPRFEAALPFSGGRARVKLDGRWRLIDKRDIGPPTKPAIPALIAALKDRHDAVRIFAAKTLAKIGPGALGALAEALKDENESVRSAAARIIGEMGSKAEPAIPALVTALKGKDESASSNAAQALGQMGPPAIPSLIEALKDPHDHVRRNAARGLLSSYIKDEDARDDYARRNPGSALRRQDATAAVPALIQALKDIDAPVRQAAAGALQVIKPQTKEAADALIAALKDQDSGTRSSAANGIVSIILNSSRSSPFVQALISALIEAFKDQDPEVSKAAARALWAMGSVASEAVPALIEGLKSPDPSIRLSSAQVVQRIGPAAKAAVPALADLLRDQDSAVRSVAAFAMGAMGQEAKSAIPALIKVLKEDKSEMVRLSAADALGRFGPNARVAIPALIEALDSKNPTVPSFMAGKLADISKALRDAKATDSISLLKDAYNALLKSKDPAVSSFASSVKQAIDYLESIR
ncbi:MAG: HEAT repeat domain-containing protein [Acidobacteriota bacterium]